MQNDKLAEVFQESGVKFLIGADEVNRINYDQYVQIAFMYNLFTGKEAYQALIFAKAK